MSSSITLSLAELNRAFEAVAEASVRTEPIMRAIAGIMAGAVEDAFEQEADPRTGARWPVLSPAYARQRAEQGHAGKMLQVSGSLATSISREHSKDFARVGSNKAYAAIHQFGGTTRPHVIRPKHKKALKIPGIGLRGKVNHPGSRIPARPFLGVSPDHIDEMREVVTRHLLRALSRNRP